MSTETTTISQEVETPFLSGARKSGSSVSFWSSYVQSRPSPTEDFFQLIHEYHKSHGDPCTDIAHDVGTGPGNIAARLAPYFNHVVGSDVNGEALEAAKSILPAELLHRMSFMQSPAEDLARKTPVQLGGQGTTDLVVVSECMPLLDTPVALKAFNNLLRPGGTLGIYFYGRAVFTDGNIDACNVAYDRVATHIYTFNHPMKGTPGFPFHLRAAEALISNLDNISLPAEDWESVERYKWNCDYPLNFSSKAGFDFDFSPVDRRGVGDVTKEIIDRNFWAAEWSIDDIKRYFDSVYPNYRLKAGERYAEVEAMLEDLRLAMGGEKRKVTFPLVLILAKKKAPSNTTTISRAKKVQLGLSPNRLGYGRLNDLTPESVEMANKLLQKNHDEYHIFFRDLNGHNHMAHSILTHFAMGATPSELQRANDDGESIQRARPELNMEVVNALSDDNIMFEIMGQLSQYSNALEFFEKQIDLFGWRAVLDKYCFSRTEVADTILSRMYDGAHHPFIHLGLAVEFELPSITAEALAQAVCHPFSGIPDCLLQTDMEAGPLDLDAPRRHLLDLYEEARSNETILTGAKWEDGTFKMRDGTLGRSRAEITRLAAQYRVKPSELELRAAEVINCSAYIAGATQLAEKTAKIDFFFMHNVTSSVFLTVLVNDPMISLENKVRMVEWKGRTDLFWYAACGCPKYDITEVFNYVPGPSTSMDWNELYSAVFVMKDDGHVAKFTRAVKSAEDVCKRFEQQHPASFPMTGTAWLQLARMCYDSTVGLPDPEKWIFGTGFPQAWENVPGRAPPPSVKPGTFPSFTK